MKNKPVKIENPDSKYWKFRWTIKHFSNLKTQSHSSDKFLVGSHKCQLRIYPKRKREEDYFLSIYLNIDPLNELSLEFKLALLDQIDNTYTVAKASKHQFTDRGHSRGFPRMMPHYELHNSHRGYIVNDTVIVEADICINEVTESLTQNSEKVVSDKSDDVEQEVDAPTGVMAPIVLSDNMMGVEQQGDAHAGILPTSTNKDQLSGQVVSKSSSEAVKPTEALDVNGQVEIGVSLEGKSPETQTEPEEQGEETWTLVEPATPTYDGNIASGLARQARTTASLCEYPTAGQLFEEGQHCQSFVDDKFEDIGGFNVLKSQASLYKQIWMKYGHIATSKVLISSYYGQVAVVSDIMICITEIHQCHSSELSSEMIDSWEKKIKMAEKLEFNIVWFRECFDRVKNDFYLEEELKVAIVEKDIAKAKLIDAEEKLVLANKEVVMSEEKLSAVESKITSLLLQKEMLPEKGRFIF